MLHYLNYGGHVIICNDAFKQELDETFFKLLKKEFMSEFKQFRRKQTAELREVTESDVNFFNRKNYLSVTVIGSDSSMQSTRISISEEDLKAGSPKLGDMIARNPKNHNDQWLVAQKYFEDNFEGC